MKKMWKKPELEVLDIRMTMNGPGNAIADCYDVGEANGRGQNHDGMSNNACKQGSPSGPGPDLGS